MTGLDSFTPDIVSHFGSADSAEAQRIELRALALSSTYIFAKLVCDYPDLDLNPHGVMAKWIQRPTKRKMGLAPRGTLKTSLWNKADKLRRGCEDPNRRMLLINEVIGNGMKWVNEMQGIVEKPLFRWLFADRLPDLNDRRTRWNQTQMDLRRTESWSEPTIEVIGVGGASTSNHYDLICEDDLVGREARESPTVMQKAIDQHILAESLLIAPDREVQTIGTRWHKHDLVDWMMKHEADNLDIFFLGVGSDCEPVWEKKFPREELLRIRDKYGPSFFALQYRNIALGDGATEFAPENLRYYSLAEVPSEEGNGKREKAIVLERSPAEGGNRLIRLRDCTIFQTIDAGLSPESKNARTAIAVTAITPAICSEDGTELEPFNIVLLESWALAVDPNACMKRSWEIFQQYDPVCAAIEVVGGHQVFWYSIPTRYPRMRLRKLKTDTHKSKETRIREFYPFVCQHRFFLRRDQANYQDEYLSFPTGTTVDLLDVEAYVPQIWHEPEPVTETGRRVERRFYEGQERPDTFEEDQADATRCQRTGY